MIFVIVIFFFSCPQYIPGHESGQGIIVDLRLNKAVLLFFTKFNVPLSGCFAEMTFAVFTLHITGAGSYTKGNGS